MLSSDRLDTVKTKIQENGKPVANIDANVLLGRADLCKPAKRADLKHTPRIASDHLVNVFFQEWSPLFPVLHRPTFLNTYEEFVNDPDSIKDPISVAQLNLVFCTAALAKQVRFVTHIIIYAKHFASRAKNSFPTLNRNGKVPWAASLMKASLAFYSASFLPNYIA